MATEDEYQAALARVMAAQGEARKRSARLSAETASRMDMAEPTDEEPPLMNGLEEADRQAREA